MVWSRAVAHGYVRGWWAAAMVAEWLILHPHADVLRAVSNFTARDELADLLDGNLAHGRFLYWCPAHPHARSGHAGLQGRFYVDARWRDRAAMQDRWARLLSEHRTLVAQDEAREHGMFTGTNCSHFIVPCRGFAVPRGIGSNLRRKKEFADMVWAVSHAKDIV